MVDDDETSPEDVTLVVPQPAAAEIYYSACAAVDQHNRDRQDTLCIELKLKTHDWARRVNLSIFGMIVVDTWLERTVAAHLSPTKHKRKDKDGNELTRRFEGSCRVCRDKTTFQCSLCVDSDDITDAGWCCMTVNEKDCFAKHCMEKHGFE